MLKPINFGHMMLRHLNEVFSYSGNLFREQMKFLDSHNFIIRSLTLKYLSFIEKVIVLFHPAESQHFENKMLAFFFCPILKEKQL